MAKMSQNLIIGSMIAAAVVGVVAIVDMAIAFPYSRNILMDIFFLVGAGLVGYMGYDAYKDVQ